MENRTNIYLNLLHHYFSDYVSALPQAEREKISSTGGSFSKAKRMLRSVALELKRTLKAPKINAADVQGKVWAFVYSQNNYDALAFAQSIDNVVFVSDRQRTIKNCTKLIALPYPSRVPYFGEYSQLLKALVAQQGKRASDISDFIWNANGWYEITLELLRTYRPKAIILSNDHSLLPRAMMLAAKVLNIPTIFIQHASVTEHFPPLQFDLSLLEGQAAWDNYKKIGEITGRVELIGMPKFDKFVSKRKKPTAIKSLGIAFNLTDDLGKILALCDELHKLLPDLQLCVRPHPKDPTPHDWSATHAYISKSTGAQESAFEFLSRHDAIVANNTSIHLEALLLNMPSFYMDISRPDCRIDDLYGYIANNMVPVAKNAAELATFIAQHNEKLPDVYPKAAYYNALVGTPNEGRSEELVKQYIIDFLAK